MEVAQSEAGAHYFQMPLHLAAKRLGLCQTAIKKACRKLGINKWPYKEMRSPWGKEGWMGEGEGGGPGAPRAAMSGAAEGRWWTEALKGAAASPAVTGVPPPALFADRLKVEVETSEGASADVMSAVNALLSLQR
ncbi:hypothetical protein T484DRAFT_2335199 [Baffinella frigidus]|nr:hypothetical protein T484DRAFT_2335199 [Cryptophyta sp. CCMP2293]